MTKNIYYNIDMEKTGILLRNSIFKAGYSVKEVQEALQLSCPQPIYRWFKGKILPSLDHLYVLSKLLGIHMEELIVPRMLFDGRELSDVEKRLFFYWIKLKEIA